MDIGYWTELPKHTIIIAPIIRPYVKPSKSKQPPQYTPIRKIQNLPADQEMKLKHSNAACLAFNHLPFKALPMNSSAAQ